MPPPLQIVLVVRMVKKEGISSQFPEGKSFILFITVSPGARMQEVMMNCHPLNNTTSSQRARSNSPSTL